MLPGATALTTAWPAGVVGCGVRRTVGTSLFGSALPDIEASGLFVYTGCLQPPARCSVLWPLLTSRPVAPAGSPQVRTRWLPLASLVAAVTGGPSPLRSAPGTTAAFTSATGPFGFVLLASRMPARRVTSALLCGSCPSARRFGTPAGRSSRFGLALSLRSGPLAFLPPVGYPSGVGFGW